jgi:hypothetical protein
VKLTRTAAAVAARTAAGHIRVARSAQRDLDIARAQTESRNPALGPSANTALVTTDPPGIPVEGIAGRCP